MQSWNIPNCAIWKIYNGFDDKLTKIDSACCQILNAVLIAENKHGCGEGLGTKWGGQCLWHNIHLGPAQQDFEKFNFVESLPKLASHFDPVM